MLVLANTETREHNMWTIVFERNGRQYTKAFPTWLAMMNWADAQNDIKIINFK